MAGLAGGGAFPAFAQTAEQREILLGAVGRAGDRDATGPRLAEPSRGGPATSSRAGDLLTAARNELTRNQPLVARQILESLIEQEPSGPLAEEARRLLAPIYAGNYGTQGVVEGQHRKFSLQGLQRSGPGDRVSELRNGGMNDVSVQHDVADPMGRARPREAHVLSPRVTRLLENDFRARVGDRVFFGEASADIGAKSRAILSAQAVWLKRNPVVRILIEAHAHDRGSRQHNLQLSLKRAGAVRARLVEEGVPADRIRIQAYGNERPIATCDAAACAAQNRRVVSVLVGSDGGHFAGDGDKRHARP
ncbi:MAG: OmpA family protein [Hyphomicrobiaceae bacterium]